MSGTADRLRCCQLRWTVGVVNWWPSSVTSLSLTVDICVQHGCEALRYAGLSAAAETCRYTPTQNNGSAFALSPGVDSYICGQTHAISRKYHSAYLVTWIGDRVQWGDGCRSIWNHRWTPATPRCRRRRRRASVSRLWCRRWSRPTCSTTYYLHRQTPQISSHMYPTRPLSGLDPLGVYTCTDCTAELVPINLWTT